MPNYSKKPSLKESDEEYAIMLEVCEEFEKQKTDKTLLEKVGKAPEAVIRMHLTKKGLNISNVPKVTVQGSKIENDLLLLKPGVDPNQQAYASAQVKMAIEVKNSGAAGEVLEDGKREDPNKTLKFKFNELEALSGVKNFAVIVISETLVPPKGPFKWRFKEDAIGKQNCKVFTLVARGLYPPGGLYKKANIVEMLQNELMKKTEEYQQLINYLKCL
jgi:hypothetical protein